MGEEEREGPGVLRKTKYQGRTWGREGTERCSLTSMGGGS